MSNLLEREMQKIKTQMPWVLTFFIVVGVLPYIHFHYLDGVYYNKVFTFNDGVDPSNLQTQYEAYCPGEPVYIETNFCKTRQVEITTTSWWSSNGTLRLASSDMTRAIGGSQLPLGCLPTDGEGRILAYIHDVPDSALPGTEFSIGYSRYQLATGEMVDQAYRTEKYTIKSEDECAL